MRRSPARAVMAELDGDVDASTGGAPSPRLSMPPPARLPPPTPKRKPSHSSVGSSSGFQRRGPLSPSILDLVARPTAPSSSVSASTARFPDLSKPQPVQLGLSRSISASKGYRSRSASIGSLKSLAGSPPRRSSATTLSNGSGDSDGAVGARTSEDLPPIEDEADDPWRAPKWWPFAVVDPDAPVDKGKRRADDQDAVDGAGEEDALSFLSYFAGRGTVEAARRAHEADAQADLAEAESLDADLDMLRIASTASNDGRPVDAPPPLPPKDKAPSFLPTNMFSSNPFTIAPLEGPGSLFSSFSLPNPFNTSPTIPQHSPRSSFSLASPFTPATTSAPSNVPHHGRSYSSGPGGTKLHDVTPMLDEEDTEAAKLEDDSHMDMFSLIKERYSCPKYPIVFCHGLFGAHAFIPRFELLTDKTSRLRHDRPRRDQAAAILVLDWRQGGARSDRGRGSHRPCPSGSQCVPSTHPPLTHSGQLHSTRHRGARESPLRAHRADFPRPGSEPHRTQHGPSPPSSPCCSH